jgi:hypothetical protein
MWLIILLVVVVVWLLLVYSKPVYPDKVGENLYVSRMSKKDLGTWKDAGIKRVIHLTNMRDISPIEGLDITNIVMKSPYEPKYFAISNSIEDTVPTVITCDSGLVHAPAVAIYHLRRTKNMSYGEAYGQVRKNKRFFLPKKIKEFLKKPTLF